MFLLLRLHRLLLSTVIFFLLWPAFFLGYEFWAACCRFLNRPIDFPRSGHGSLILICSFVWLFLAEKNHVTSVDELYRERTGARNATSAVFTFGILSLATLFFVRDSIIPRGFFLLALFALLCLTLVTRALFRLYFRTTRRWGRTTKILFLGADQFAEQAAERFMRLTHTPCQVVGYVRVPGQTPTNGCTEIFEMTDVGKLNEAHFFDELIIAIPPSEFPQIPQLIKSLERLSVPARAIVDLGEGVVVRERLFQFGRMQMLDLTQTPADSLDYALLKRTFDICFSSLVLLLTAPLFALIAALIRLTSPGSIFFVQERVGLNGHRFLMYKFRTMNTSSQSHSDTTWTTEEDPRRTKLGTFLRMTSLDELPQFYNVLRGDMSVVGPRPERPHFVQRFLQDFARYNNRHCLKVGITGWAQVNGWRGDTSIEKRVEYDLYYLQNWSFSFDLLIIGRTILSLLNHRNAY